MFQGRLFMAWRTAPMHFASDKTRMYMMSSPDLGASWEFEHEIYTGRDMREPYFIVLNNTLIFSFFSAGTNPLSFDPHRLLHTRRVARGEWTTPEPWGQPGEIAWQYQEWGDKVYVTSYIGNHYKVSRPQVSIFLNVSEDGWNWHPVDEEGEASYIGGANEVGWAFDLDGNFWGVLRNEDGDDSGFGSRLVFGHKDALANWTLSPASKSDPNIYESSRMFRHGNDIYLVARRDINGVYDWGLSPEHVPFEVRRGLYMGSYSLRAHTTSLFRVDKTTGALEFIMDLMGCGDTAFPSIQRIGKHKYLIANYSSPLKHHEWSWIHGQTSKEGTQIFFFEIDFTAI